MTAFDGKACGEAKVPAREGEVLEGEKIGGEAFEALPLFVLYCQYSGRRSI